MDVPWTGNQVKTPTFSPSEARWKRSIVKVWSTGLSYKARSSAGLFMYEYKLRLRLASVMLTVPTSR